MKRRHPKPHRIAVRRSVPYYTPVDAIGSHFFKKLVLVFSIVAALLFIARASILQIEVTADEDSLALLLVPIALI